MPTERSPHAATSLGRLYSSDPFRSLQQQMDDLLSNFSLEWHNGGRPAAEGRPSLDLSETGDAILVSVDLPGIKPEDVDVQVRGNDLQISGERREEKEEKGKTWHRTERHVGTFARSLTLPCDVQAEKVTAEFRDGVLNITLPKAEQSRTRKIAVTSKSK